MFRGPKSFEKGGYRTDEAPKRTLQQQGLEGMMRLPKSFQGLSDRHEESVRTVTKATDETKAGITETLGE